MEEVNRKETDQNTTKTMPDLEGEHEVQEDQDLIRLRVSTTSLSRPALLGIGVAIKRMTNGATDSWALKDRSYGNKNIDAASAVRFVLCKALERGWCNIRIQIQNKDLLRQIMHGKSSDCRLTTILEDILSLKSLFRMCSFCLDSNDDSNANVNISSYGLGILLDEKSLFPLCY